MGCHLPWTFLKQVTAAASEAVADAPLTERVVVAGDAVGLVGVEPRGPPAVGAAPGADPRDALDERLDGLRVVHVRARDAEYERQPGPVGQDMVSMNMVAANTCRSRLVGTTTLRPLRRDRDQGLDGLPQPIGHKTSDELMQHMTYARCLAHRLRCALKHRLHAGEST